MTERQERKMKKQNTNEEGGEARKRKMEKIKEKYRGLERTEDGEVEGPEKKKRERRGFRGNK